MQLYIAKVRLEKYLLGKNMINEFLKSLATSKEQVTITTRTSEVYMDIVIDKYESKTSPTGENLDEIEFTTTERDVVMSSDAKQQLREMGVTVPPDSTDPKSYIVKNIWQVKEIVAVSKVMLSLSSDSSTLP